MIHSLTYVSSSRLDEEQARKMVDEIVASSRSHNEGAGITGALIFTGKSFAQTLEGERDLVISLMQRISHDNRHENIAIVHEAGQPSRDFVDWTMAYRGLTTFVQRHVDAVRTAGDREVAVLELRALLRAFAQETAG